jgi:hypothetical protein
MPRRRRSSRVVHDQDERALVVRYEFPDVVQVDEVRAMGPEEVAGEPSLQIRQREVHQHPVGGELEVAVPPGGAGVDDVALVDEHRAVVQLHGDAPDRSAGWRLGAGRVVVRWLVLVAVQRAVQGASQTGGVERLHQVVGSTDVEGVHGVVGVGGREDDRRGPVVGPQGRRHVEARAPGHADVEQHDVVVEGCEQDHGLVGVAGLTDHLHVGEVPQEEAQLLPRGRLVVDDQAARPPHGVHHVRWRVHRSGILRSTVVPLLGAERMSMR